MSKLKLALLAVYASCTLPVIAAEWTATDRALLVGAYATELADYSQTMQLPGRPDLYEQNPILGTHPSKAKITAYFAGAAVATYVIDDVLPPVWRTTYLGGVIVFEAVVVKHNTKLGVTIHF